MRQPHQAGGVAADLARTPFGCIRELRIPEANYGVLLLGVLIEKVSGKSYCDFVAENIYKVAGMTDSGSEPESVKVANRSKGYMRGRFDIVSNAPTLPWRGTSAGDGYTTAADLMKFAGALMANKLLKAETLADARVRNSPRATTASDSNSDVQTRRGPTATEEALRE